MEDFAPALAPISRGNDGYDGENDIPSLAQQHQSEHVDWCLFIVLVFVLVVAMIAVGVYVFKTRNKDKRARAEMELQAPNPNPNV